MISVQDAFRKFRSRLELTKGEQEDASRRQQEIRAAMDGGFAIETDFLTGSYARWTKTKPLKDIDIFSVLKESENHYRSKHPSVLLGAVEDLLVKKYGRDNVSKQNRSVTVSFGVVEVNV
jgi:predicted nucleotidyltransferase